MASQADNEIKNPSPAERASVIHTMRSDAEALIKTGKPSLARVAMDTQEPEPLNMNSRFGPAQSSRKVPLRTVAIVLGILILAGAGAFVFWNGVFTSAPLPNADQTPTPIRTSPLPAYFATETSRTITVKKSDRPEFLRLMQDAWQEREQEGTIKRIILKVQDGPNERFATLADFFQLWRITPPQELIDQADPNLMLFIHYGASGNRLGFAVRAHAGDRMLAAMLRWETSVLAQITPLFFDAHTDILVAPFEDRTYRNIDWRYLKLSQAKDLGIGHALFPAGSVFVFTTSKESMETVINRLFAQ